MSIDLTEIGKVERDGLSRLDSATTTQELQQIKQELWGKTSVLPQMMSKLKDLSPEERKQAGSKLNQAQQNLEKKFLSRIEELELAEINNTIQSEFLDITLPGIPAKAAKLHPHTQERIRIEEIFQQMGFTVRDPYLVDSDYNNFVALNIPDGHPARDMWDTLRISEQLALIVHTSSMQNRILSSQEPPIRAIVPGKTFRNEATDARHEHSFFQVEGIYVDRGIKLSDLLGTIQTFLNNYFGKEMPIKVQPTYFPFVEPGLEIMMECPVCEGRKEKGCAGCSGSGWMEVIPCGMIHPFVLKEAGLDPNVYSGFAWGFGLDRLIMIKNNIKDVRLFHSGRLDFLEQF